MSTKVRLIATEEQTLGKTQAPYRRREEHRKVEIFLTTLTVLFISTIVLSGCASGPLFHATFDADTVGLPPNTTPPGQPVGDLIYLSDVTNTPGHIIVVNSADLGSKSLQYANVDVPLYARFVGFMSKEENLGANQKFRAIWVGRVDLESSGSALDIWLGDSHFLALAALRLKDGQVLLRTSNAPAYESIGSYNESQNHTVFITIDKQSQKYSIVMVPGSVLSGWRTVLSSQALTTNRPTLYFHYGEEKSSSAKYVVDNVMIEKVK